jgi:phage shock protein PspC (stress-responsive transcriptional regulator)
MTETTSHSAPQARRLERSRSDRKVAGVAGGLAQYFDLDPIIFRIGFIILTVLGGSGLLVYVAGWLILPEEGKDESIAADVLRNRREKPWALIGLGLLALAGLILLGSHNFWPSGGGIWIVLAIVGAIILWRQRRADSRPRRWLRITLGVLTALIVAAVAATTVAAFSVGHVTDGVGERIYRVSSVSELQPRYKLGTGRLEIDLSQAQLPAGTTAVSLRLGVGELHVVPPAGATVRYHADVHAGNIVVDGSQREGWRIAATGVRKAGAVANAPVLVVYASVGLGKFSLDPAAG